MSKLKELYDRAVEAVKELISPTPVRVPVPIPANNRRRPYRRV